MKKLVSLFLILMLCVLCASCGKAKPSADIPLSTVMQEIRANVPLPEMLDLTADNLSDYFGIDSGEITDFAVCINANGYEKEEIVLLRATDTACVQSLAEKLNTSLDNAAAEMQNYLPQQYALVKASAVRIDGLVVSLCISENAEQIDAVLDKYFR